MFDPAECRRRGEECLELAELIPPFRQALIEVAEAWFRLAAEGVVTGMLARSIRPHPE